MVLMNFRQCVFSFLILSGFIFLEAQQSNLDQLLRPSFRNAMPRIEKLEFYAADYQNHFKEILLKNGAGELKIQRYNSTNIFIYYMILPEDPFIAYPQNSNVTGDTKGKRAVIAAFIDASEKKGKFVVEYTIINPSLKLKEKQIKENFAKTLKAVSEKNEKEIKLVKKQMEEAKKIETAVHENWKTHRLEGDIFLIVKELKSFVKDYFADKRNMKEISSFDLELIDESNFYKNVTSISKQVEIARIWAVRKNKSEDITEAKFLISVYGTKMKKAGVYEINSSSEINLRDKDIENIQSNIYKSLQIK